MPNVVAMAAIRSVGDLGTRAFGLLDKQTWAGVVGAADVAAVWCLTIAMASVGLGTGLSKLTRLGWKPFSVGFAAALLVGAVSTILVKLLVPFMVR